MITRWWTTTAASVPHRAVEAVRIEAVRIEAVRIEAVRIEAVRTEAAAGAAFAVEDAISIDEETSKPIQLRS